MLHVFGKPKDSSKMLLNSAVTLLCLVTASTALPGPTDGKKIDWQPCPELNKNISILNGVEGTPFDCAKLSVPLDYTNVSSPSLNLDLFRVNATKQPVLGSVLINFGGPGGTGAENLPVLATEMAKNIGEQWNLLSWDPRGTGKTIPFDCKINFTENASTDTRKRDVTLASANLTEYFLNGGWDNAGFIADTCYAVMNETGDYITTASTARDLINIVDALGEDGLLRYYGWSYGTVLGSYVAAMFPDRVESVVLDANLNPYSYQAGHYGDFVLDANKAFSAFLGECLANRDKCALAQYSNSTNAEEMLEMLNLLYEPLVTNATTSDVAWYTYAAAQQLVLGDLYWPRQWPRLADTLTSLLNGSYTSTATSTPAPSQTVDPYNLGTWSTFGVRAGDALVRTDSAEEYLPHVLYQDEVSSFDTNYPSLWVSARWKMGKDRYQGDFNVKTRKPILYVNGEYDPVTPLENAYSASTGFEGSFVLPHSGYGHGIVADPSECVAKYIQAFFANGTLPESGAYCKPDLGPWESAKSEIGS